MASVHHQPGPRSSAAPASDITPSRSSRAHLHPQQRPPPPPSPSSLAPHSQPPPPRSSKSRRHSLPFFSFPLVSQSNASSTSLVPSTAEGRPIPLDDSTAAHRTTALRELNRSQPSSRHRYTKSTGPPSTATRTTTGTYSQPVIVRTYSGPPPSSAASRPASRRIPLSSISVSSNASNWRPGRNGMALNMARYRGNKKSASAGNDVKLPPLEAFSFKSIMADMQQDVGADLDRIAEICARSKYSLSNQYEVHMVPHGNGNSFLAGASSSSARPQALGGPTLQAIPSDDERSSTRQKKRRSGARRRSAAYSNLETIMSSSRSSEEDKSKKKSAREIADDVRGRTSKKRKDGSGSGGSRSSGELSYQTPEDGQNKVAKRKSTTFANAVMDSTRHGPGESGSPRSSGAALVSEPARPKTSRNHLEIRTSQETGTETRTPDTSAEPSRAVVSASVAAAAIASPDEARGPPSLLAGFGNWMPWRGTSVTEVASSDNKGSRSRSYAEGSLRELLKTTDPAPSDSKGKSNGQGP